MNMRQINWKTLGPVRIQGKPKDGLQTYLLYQNSRTTGNAFDEMFGEFGWQLTYKDVGGQIYGCISVWDNDKQQWISKEDTGEESNIAAQKGLSSDILKRVAVRWGFGRELYTSPKIQLPEHTPRQLNVADIGYDDNRNIIYLKLVDNWGKVHYEWTKGQTVVQNQTKETKPQQPSLTKEEVIKTIREQCNSLWVVTPKEQRETLKNYANWWINRVEEKGYEGSTFNLYEKFSKHLQKKAKSAC